MANELENIQELRTIAQAMVVPAKGILAADESTGTIKRRFDAIGVENTEENRRDYREMLFRTPVGQYLSGVILYEETIRQKAADGTPLVKLLQDQGIMPGIKVDMGAKPLPGSPRETVTEGLDGLRERLAEYRELGAKFTKWRGVITIVGNDLPSPYCINVNAHALARYAALSQEAGLVPIVEPEVIMDGEHSIDRAHDVTEATLREVFTQLANQRVAYEGMVLKPNMVLSGYDGKSKASAEEVAEKTLRCFKHTVPAAVAGIAFLSGGQNDDDAILNLDAINRLAARVGAPWQISFSYGRGLQAAPQKAWGGKKENVEKAQQAFLHRAKVTSAARQGSYNPELEKELTSV
ncbi:MAG: class I fructose-bisphosphate aldolase [Dehalococcoidia bacterium]